MKDFTDLIATILEDDESTGFKKSEWEIVQTEEKHFIDCYDFRFRNSFSGMELFIFSISRSALINIQFLKRYCPPTYLAVLADVYTEIKTPVERYLKTQNHK